MTDGPVVKRAHGSGGRLTRFLVEEVFAPRLGMKGELGDAAAVAAGPTAAVTTDSFVVQPLFFPGGDIGKLAVCGTVNDLAAAGARPVCLAAAFVIEEGTPVRLLERVAESMGRTAAEAGVPVVAGDTKVVGRGEADGLFITTTGVGVPLAGKLLDGSGARPGDAVIVSAPLARHGAAVMAARHALPFKGKLESDCAPLAGMTAAAFEAAGEAVHAMRDPTRGGLATALIEIAKQSGVTIVLDEEEIPADEAASAACELLGLDPLYVANEGVMAFLVKESAAGEVLRALRAHPLGARAAAVGRVEEGEPGLLLRTAAGGTRRLIMLEGDPLPRIC